MGLRGGEEGGPTRAVALRCLVRGCLRGAVMATIAAYGKQQLSRAKMPLGQATRDNRKTVKESV